MFEPYWTWRGTASLFASFIAYQILKAIYRITLHPLAEYPGPRLASMTYKYEFYFDGIQNGMYTNEISRMHDEYGPIVRINPDELHCNDPEFVDQIYAGPGEKRDKWSYFLNGFGPRTGMGGFGTVNHDLHRIRRAPLNKYFSKASIAKLEPSIHDLAHHLCDKLLARCGNGQPFDLTMAYSCFTTDVITSYCFGQTHGLLDQEDWEPNLRQAVFAGLRTAPIIKQWPDIAIVMDQLPEAIVKALSTDIAVFINYINELTERVRNIKTLYDDGKLDERTERPTIFAELLRSDLPEKEKSVERLGADSTSIIAAGTETTAWALSNLTFYLLAQPLTCAKLVAELETVVSDPKNLPNWRTLEQLPYLISFPSPYATLLESIRLSYGIGMRLARISPDKALIYEGSFEGQPVNWIIPPGTPIGMSSRIMHSNTTIFPDPESFQPERWINENGTRRTELERYLMSFSKGSRQCLGMNLAYCELYIVAAALVLRVLPHMELYETTEDDIKYHHDMFVPMPRPEGKGLRIIMK